MAIQIIHEDAMPFKRRAQRPEMCPVARRGQISTFEEWNRETGGRKLPEHVRVPAATSGRPKTGRGRRREVRDDRNRLIRTNHVVFPEGGGDVNQTVSRTHAHIAYESRTGQFRLHDDGSEYGTDIVRGGRTISVHRGTRGVRLRSDDEVVFGEASVRVTLRAA